MLPPLLLPRLNYNSINLHIILTIVTNHFKLSEQALDSTKGVGSPTPRADPEIFGSFFGDEKFSRIEHSFGESTKIYYIL